MSDALPTIIQHYPVTVELSLQWGEMDAFAHLNNVIYFRYFETARIRYFEKIALLDYMHRHKIGPILKNAECTFKIPLTYPDQIVIGVSAANLEPDRFMLNYVAFSHQHQKIAATGSSLIVMFDYSSGTKAPVPTVIQENIARLTPPSS